MGSYSPDPLTIFTDDDRWAPLPEEPSTVLVTPEIARNWLDTRAHPDVAHNRRRSKARILEYAEQMANGQWRATHQGIAFTAEERDFDGNLMPRTGVLVDGQHRLEAICLAKDLVRGAHQVKTPTPEQEAIRRRFPDGKIAIPMWVHPGLPADTFAYMDLGLKRTAAQLYQGKGAGTIASAARWLVPGKIGLYQNKVQPAEVLKLIDSWGELSTHVSNAMAAAKSAGIPAAQHLAILAQAERTRNRGEIQEWLEGLTEGLNLKAGDPRLKTRERFRTMPKEQRGNRELVYNNLVKGWNAWAAGERMQVLSWRFTEGTQKVRGFDE